MAYIRTNDDYDRAMGFDPVARRAQLKKELKEADQGYCNPIKAKHIAELEEELRNLK